MRRRFHLLLLLLAVVPLMLLTRWGGEAKSPWDPVRGGLQARLHCPRATWRVGESVEVRLRLRNVGARPRVVEPHPVLTLEESVDGRLAGSDTRAAILATRAFTLQPGEVLDVVLHRAPTDLRGPGVHAFSGVLGDVALLPVEVRVVPTRG